MITFDNGFRRQKSHTEADQMIPSLRLAQLDHLDRARSDVDADNVLIGLE
jgi:hypothetical protein